MKKHEIFAQCMAAAGAVFDKEITSTISEIYWRVLEPYPIEDVKAAFDHCIRSNKFFPKPAELITAIEGTTETRTAVAWATLKQTMSGVGSYTSVQFNDPVMHSVVEAMGGWIELCRTTEHDLHFREREFKQLYEAFSRRDKHPEYLCGEHEADNRQKGFLEHIKKPTTVQLEYVKDVPRIEHEQKEPLRAIGSK